MGNNARTFGQDLMRGEHELGGGAANAGVLMPSATAGDPGFYKAKREAEARLGRALTTDEFLADHYTPPDAPTASGTSIFDPVLCELAYSWFCPPGGTVLDPFAGGSVRGIIAALLGRRYHGFELRPEQVAANREQWAAIDAAMKAAPTPAISDPDALTPVETIADVWVKRDDLFVFSGMSGGKVRTCLALARRAEVAGKGGLVTAGSRASPQVNIVARVAQGLGLSARCHTPTGVKGPELVAAEAAGAQIVQHKAGYNNVIVARAREDAKAAGWAEIPFGMECQEAVNQTRRQVRNLPAEVTRIVMPCGSGMSLAGVLHGLDDLGRGDVEVCAVQVGADPTERLDAYAPADWRARVRLVPSGLDYHDPAPTDTLGLLRLDPFYEAKCLPFLRPGDLFWVVGIRATSAEPASAVVSPAAAGPAPVWTEGDSALTLPAQGELRADFVFSCPPYGDLEVYSDDPADLSTMDRDAFLVAFRGIIAAALARLRQDRFACVVVGDYRDRAGFYCNFVSETIAAFEASGARLYNEAILVTAVGSLPVRVGRQFETTRKLGKTHQNVLVFCKGDPKKATEACGPVAFGTGIEDDEAA